MSGGGVEERQKGQLHPRDGRFRPGATSPADERRRLPLPVILGLMLIGGLCALLALNTASAAQELKQRALTDSNANTSDAEQQLLRDLAVKQAPGSLASAAAAQGLVPNPNPAFLRINADGSVTVLGSPTPASVPPPAFTPSATASPSASASKTAAAKLSAAASSKAGTPAARVTVTVTAPAPKATPTARPSSSVRPTASPHPKATTTATGGAR